MDVVHITPTFAVTAALVPGDFESIGPMGFRQIVSNLPDGEEHGQMNARQEAVQAWRQGLLFAHVPAAKHDPLSDPVVERMANVLRNARGPVLAHCKSGVRSAILWAAASARSQPVDCVLAALKQAGFDLEFMRDELRSQADRKHWIGVTPPALDCGASVGILTRPAKAA